MKAIVYEGVKDVRVEEVEDPKIEREDDVVVRVDPSFTPRVHIDFDEANACAYQSGDFGMIIRG